MSKPPMLFHLIDLLRKGPRFPGDTIEGMAHDAATGRYDTPSRGSERCTNTSRAVMDTFGLGGGLFCIDSGSLRTRNESPIAGWYLQTWHKYGFTFDQVADMYQHFGLR